MRPTLRVTQLDAGLPVPAYQHDGDAGLDLYSAQDVVIAAGERVVVDTGIAVAIPEGYAGFTTPRSGSAARDGLSIVNTPGIIDSGYRGEVRMILINLDPREPITVRRGERIAQLLIVPVASVDVIVTDDLGVTQRGQGGLGSTGR